jgi:transposase
MFFRHRRRLDDRHATNVPSSMQSCELREQALDSEGEPIAWPVALAGDKAYRADWIDDCLLELEITPVIPSKKNEDADARPIAFNKKKYRRRNIIERPIGWLKESRRILTRFEKTAKNFAGMLKMAFIHRYLRLTCN